MDLAKLKAFAPQLDWERGAGQGRARQCLRRWSSPKPPRSRKSASCSKACRSTRGRTIWPSTSSATTPPICPRISTRRSFDFYSKTLRDVPNQRDRWKRGVDLVNGALGEAVGQIYVQRHYPPESEPADGRADRQFPRRACRRRSRPTAGWTRPTKKEALAKLATFDPRTGHPAKYIDYSTPEGRPLRPARQRACGRSNSTGTCCWSG